MEAVPQLVRAARRGAAGLRAPVAAVPGTALVVVVALVLALAACSDRDQAGGPGPGPSTSDPEEQAVDWADRTVDVTAPDDWAVSFCEGEAPLLCISRAGAPVGVVELLDLHRATLPALDDGLDALARDLYETTRLDRSQGCGSEYRIEEEPPEPAPVAGGAGIRYAFTGFTAVDRPAERTVGYAVQAGDAVFLVAASAYETDGCVGTEGGDFTVDDLRDFEPVLADIAAASRLPERAGDGATSGHLRGVDPSGQVLLDHAEILSGPEATRAARDAGVIGPEEELDTDFFVLDPEATTVELELTAGTRVELYECTAGCQLRSVAAADFLAGTAVPQGGQDALYSITFVDGDVVALVEQYLP